jgi:hypothetical protein
MHKTRPNLSRSALLSPKNCEGHLQTPQSQMAQLDADHGLIIIQWHSLCMNFRRTSLLFMLKYLTVDGFSSTNYHISFSERVTHHITLLAGGIILVLWECTVSLLSITGLRSASSGPVIEANVVRERCWWLSGWSTALQTGTSRNRFPMVSLDFLLT